MTTPPEKGDSKTPPRVLRVLVADDEPLIRRALQRLFEKRGHEVLTARDAHEARSLLADHHFDAALIDARMPGDGVTVIRELESDADFSGVLMLMSGALSTDPSIQVGPRVKRLQKPFRFPDVIPLVEDSVRH